MCLAWLSSVASAAFDFRFAKLGILDSYHDTDISLDVISEVLLVCNSPFMAKDAHS
jgi:hypothetical protein